MIEEILAERHKIHGDFTEDARISQAIKDIYHSAKGWSKLSAAQRESMEQEATKNARILSGNPDHPDHWQDKAGYATLVVQRLAPKNEITDIQKIAERFAKK